MAVSAGHPAAIAAATTIAKAGGNAVDAAVAAAFALAVVLPDACGLGGDALLTIRTGDGQATSFNGVGTAPAGLQLPLPGDGAKLATVPGFVAGLADAHARFGTLGWDQLIAPAVDLAVTGTEVSQSLADGVADHADRLRRGGGENWPWLGDRPPATGAVVRQPGLADALLLIAQHGTEGFATGPVAAAITRAAAREGGTLTETDLAAHRTVVLEPVSVRFGDATILLQPPSSQAILLGVALAALEGRASTGGAAAVHDAVEAIVGAFAYRDRVLTDPPEALLERGRSMVVPERGGERVGPAGYNHTTGVCTADAGGVVVSMLISVFDDFGCATVVPEYGFLLNDRLLGAASDPESPNAAAPGRRPVHTLAPIVVKRAGSALALATPGADGQVQVLLQLLRDVIEQGSDLSSALDAPRWRSVGAQLAVESTYPQDLTSDLEALGHSIDRRDFGDGLFGAACAAEAKGGQVSAWADPRRMVACAAV